MVVKKYFIAFILMIGLLNMLNAQVGKEDNYYPDVKLTYGFDGHTFRDNITTANDLILDEPFFILLRVSVRVPGLWRQLFGVKSVLCGLSFRSPQIIKITPIESTVVLNTEDDLKPHIVYSFPVPVTPTGTQEVRIVFYCEPQAAGQQEIRIAFDNNIADMYRYNYVFSINEP